MARFFLFFKYFDETSHVYVTVSPREGLLYYVSLTELLIQFKLYFAEGPTQDTPYTYVFLI